MYRYLDRPVAGLEAPGAFLIATMREWVAARQAGRCPCRTTAHRFVAIGLGGAADDFAMAMFTLNGEGLGTLRFGRPGCAVVSDDEAKLLALFDMPATHAARAQRRLAAALVEEAAVPRLIRAVGLVAAALAASPVATGSDRSGSA